MGSDGITAVKATLCLSNEKYAELREALENTNAWRKTEYLSALTEDEFLSVLWLQGINEEIRILKTYGRASLAATHAKVTLAEEKAGLSS